MNKRKKEDNRKNKEDYKNGKNKDYRESMNLPLHKKKKRDYWKNKDYRNKKNKFVTNQQAFQNANNIPQP